MYLKTQETQPLLRLFANVLSFLPKKYESAILTKFFTSFREDAAGGPTGPAAYLATTSVTSPRRTFGVASVMQTFTNWPARYAPLGKMTILLPSFRPW